MEEKDADGRPGGLPDEEDRVRLAVSGKLTDEKLAFGRQIGATDFVSGDDLPLDAGYFRFQGPGDFPEPDRGRGPETERGQPA